MGRRTRTALRLCTQYEQHRTDCRRSTQEQLAKLADGKPACDVCTLGLVHEQRVQLVGDLMLNLVEVAGRVVVQHDHVIQDLDGVDA